MEPQKEEEIDYLTTLFGREAVSFIERGKGRPFFLYLAFNAPHTPLEARPEDLNRISGLKGDRRTYAAMLVALDDAVGEVVDKLRETGVLDDTLIIFLSDNGSSEKTAPKGGLRGHKGLLYERGIRVPFLLHWPARFEEGIVDTRVVSALDLFPTIIEAAGGSPPRRELEGVSLLPSSDVAVDQAPLRALFWRHGSEFAVRRGAWKLLRTRSRPPALYEVATDPEESVNRADEFPALVESLMSLFAEWEINVARDTAP